FPAYGSGPFVLADLGGSSWTDLAAIDGNRSTVWVYNGSAQGIAPYPSFNIPIPGVRDLATGDFDGDGRTDLIATDGQHVLGFAHNLLAAPAIVLDAPGAGRVALGDFNSDAREDLAVLGATGARIFFQQSGPERFTSNASVDVADGIAFQSLAVGDLSGDGRDDLALGKWGEVRVYLQTAEGLLNLDPIAFSPSTSGPITLGVAAMSDVTDLVVTTSGQSGSVRLWRWGGTSFAADVTFPGPFTSGVAIGDVNDDRRVDIAVARLDGSVDIFLQQSGSFGAPVPDVVLAAASGTGGEWVGIGDVNADGFADVLVRSQNPDVFLLYLQEDAMPALIRPIPSTYVVNRGTSAKGLIDLRQFFVDDHNRLTFAVTYESEPGHLRATVDGAGLDFESEGSWFGTAEFRVTAWDGNPNHPAIESNAFTVLVNDPPRITSAPVLRATAGAAYGYLLAVEDDYPANDAHTFALLTAPEGMRVDASTGLLEWTPAAGQVGEFAVEVQVQDANGGVAVQSFTIVVSASGVGSPGILLAVGVAASSAALLAAAALLNENAKFAFLLFFLPLYTKIKRERVLDHFVRGQIFGYIQANPGEHYNAIKEALGLTNGSLAHHLRTLEREQFIKSKRYGLYRRFYPMNYRMPADDVYQPNEIQTTILAVIREHPGITQKEIAGRLTLTPPTVNYHIAVLSHRRLILVERRGRSTHCTIIEGAST
ncbi:MAG TPA: FG-GAP-like repeat-containing protein, partial [Thermoplasmata archaeon]|nr:FG-GAP-like repeat-containing protein [Thermoplasmata archaeon]